MSHKLRCYVQINSVAEPKGMVACQEIPLKSTPRVLRSTGSVLVVLQIKEAEK